MQDLCAADAIEDVHIEFFFPAPQDIGGQGLTSRDTNAHGGEIEAFVCIGQGEHTSVERGNTEEDGRAILLNHFEHVLRQWPLRVMYCARPHCEGQVEVIADTLGEEEFRACECQTLLAKYKICFW